MDGRSAKELLHIEHWLYQTREIVDRGLDAYLSDDILQ